MSNTNHLNSIPGRAIRFVGRYWATYARRDPFYVALKKWFSDNGDTTLRLDYPLDDTSVVFDVGGYRGDFAAAIHEKFQSNIYIFEPVAAFHHLCRARFKSVDNIRCLAYGLGGSNQTMEIAVCGDASNVTHVNTEDVTEKISIKSIVDVINDIGLEEIDLLKLNIEGGEYDLLSELIRSGFVERVRYIQVQFHNFIPNAESQRHKLREALSRTHEEMWNYEFVWESWRRKN